MDTITVSTKYQVVIPKAARRRLKIAPGTRLQVRETEQGIYLAKEPTLSDVRSLLRGMQWSEDEVRDESDRQLP